MRRLEIGRLSLDRLVTVGWIDRERNQFACDEGYLASADAIPLSNSLPLKPEPFCEGEFRQYFEGLVAEDMSRQALIAQL